MSKYVYLDLDCFHSRTPPYAEKSEHSWKNEVQLFLRNTTYFWPVMKDLLLW